MRMEGRCGGLRRELFSRAKLATNVPEIQVNDIVTPVLPPLSSARRAAHLLLCTSPNRSSALISVCSLGASCSILAIDVSEATAQQVKGGS